MTMQQFPLTPENVSAVSAAFVSRLRAALTADEWREMVKRNAATMNVSTCCASHDFLDANMVMQAAIADALGIPLKPDGDLDADWIIDDMCDLFNAAWSASMAELRGHA